MNNDYDAKIKACLDTIEQLTAFNADRINKAYQTFRKLKVLQLKDSEVINAIKSLEKYILGVDGLWWNLKSVLEKLSEAFKNSYDALRGLEQDLLDIPIASLIKEENGIAFSDFESLFKFSATGDAVNFLVQEIIAEKERRIQKHRETLNNEAGVK
jgi:hypothetical protein